MAWRVSAALLRAARPVPSLALALAFGTGGCVDDIRTEGDVPALHGATQPGTNGQRITADEACTRLEKAEKAARKELDCEASGFPGCPERLRLAGSLVCAEVDEGSVEECESAIAGYLSCEGFEARPCVVTVVRNTCVNPYEAGAAPPPGEGGPPPDGSVEGGLPEGSVSPPPEAGNPPPDGAPDAGPVVNDAGSG